MVTQMIMVGEESGELEEMLINVAKFYDQEVDRTVDNLTAIIEPLMMVFIGLTIGTMISLHREICNYVSKQQSIEQEHRHQFSKSPIGQLTDLPIDRLINLPIHRLADSPIN
ncbi:hypothetical protein ES705_48935 [subsurface metagenome]